MLIKGSVTGEVDGFAIIETANTSCTGCRGCNEPRSTLVNIPMTSVTGDVVSLSVTVGNQLLLASNSLLLPLMGFVTGSVIAMIFDAGDGGQMIGAIAGFLVGAVLCRRQDFSRIQIKDTDNG